MSKRRHSQLPPTKVSDIIARAAEKMLAESRERLGRPKQGNKTCMSYWLPRLSDAGILMPKTVLIRTDVELISLCDGVLPKGIDGFITELVHACEKIPGPPWFLRTGLGSGKHDWDNCCNLRDLRQIKHHVSALVEWSNCVDLFGLETDVWAVREMLPTTKLAYLPMYGNMPAVQEWRCFVRDGSVECIHPYWPKQCLRDGFDESVSDETVEDLYTFMLKLQHDTADACIKLASRVGKIVGGFWSVDILPINDQLFVTDMAEGEKSYHWQSCPLLQKPMTT
jgi:hypothetical protein